MVPIYAARIEDLGLGDFVQIECTCGHVMLLAPQMLATAGVSPIKRCSTFRAECGAGSATLAGARSCRSGGGRADGACIGWGSSGGRSGTPTCDNMPRLGCTLASLGRGQCGMIDVCLDWELDSTGGTSRARGAVGRQVIESGH
jgi:hypothetical protein